MFLNRIPNSWIRHAHVQGFDCETITLNIYINVFERMETVESIYEGVVEPSYEKPTR